MVSPLSLQAISPSPSLLSLSPDSVRPCAPRPADRPEHAARAPRLPAAGGHGAAPAGSGDGQEDPHTRRGGARADPIASLEGRRRRRREAGGLKGGRRIRGEAGVGERSTLGLPTTRGHKTEKRSTFLLFLGEVLACAGAYMCAWMRAFDRRLVPISTTFCVPLPRPSNSMSKRCWVG